MNNKTVIISCAGMGKRLGMGIPKALVEVNGKSMIIRTLEMLDNVDDVRVVVGYQAEKVIDVVNSYRKDVTFVFNHDYMNTGTGASVSLATRYAKEYILTIDGDILIHPDDMLKILNCDEEFIGVSKPSTDNPVLTQIQDDKVVAFSRDNGIYEWTGITLVKTEKIKPGVGHVYQLLESLLPLPYKMIRLKKVDTPNDYENALRWVKNNFSDNLIVGIIGGMGSFATAHFFNQLLKSFKVEKEWDRPRVIIDNRCNMPSRVRSILYNERTEELVNSLCDSVKMLLDNGCDYIVLACNTSHVFVNDIYKRIPDAKNKILNIIGECAKELSSNNIKKVKLFASEGTIDSQVYSNIFDKYQITVISPDKSDYLMIRKWIEAVKQNNITDDIKSSFVETINADNEENIIIGCTELPILYEICKESITKVIYDPLQVTINVLNELQNKVN